MRIRLELALFLYVVSAAAQQSETPASVSGNVRNSVTGLPVARATVRLAPVAGRVGYIRTTTAAGNFSMEQVAPGDYQMKVERRGFITASRTLRLAAGQKAGDLDIPVVPMASISGVVTDATGEPISTANVQLIAPKWTMHGRSFQAMSNERTNEDGEFRLTGIEPGRYYLFAGSPEEGPLTKPVREESAGRELKLAGVYYPSSTSIDGAAPVEIRAGQELTGVALRLRWAPSFHVRGRMGAGIAEEVQIVRRVNESNLPWEELEAEPGKDGSFDIAGVTAGDYWVRGQFNWRTGAALAATVDSHDVNGLAVSGALPDFRAIVRSEVEGVILHLERNESPGPDFQGSIAILPDGTARLPRISASRYLLWASAPSGGVYIKSVQIAHQDLSVPELDFRAGVPLDIEVVIAAANGKVDGTVQWPDPAKNAPPPFAAGDPVRAVLVPQEAKPGFELVRFAEIDDKGVFSFSQLPPGKCIVFVTAELDKGLWTNRDFVALVQSGGAAVEVPEKGAAQVTVPPLAAEAVRRAMEAIR